MERQYLFFNSPRAFWFAMLCGVLMIFSLFCLAFYIQPQRWQLVLFVVFFSSVAILIAYRLDSAKPGAKTVNKRN